MSSSGKSLSRPSPLEEDAAQVAVVFEFGTALDGMLYIADSLSQMPKGRVS